MEMKGKGERTQRKQKQNKQNKSKIEGKIR